MHGYAAGGESSPVVSVLSVLSVLSYYTMTRVHTCLRAASSLLIILDVFASDVIVVPPSAKPA